MRLYILLFLSLFILAGCFGTTKTQSNNVSDKNITKQERINNEVSSDEEDVVVTSYNPVSIDAMIDKEFIGSDFQVGGILADNESYTRYYITYKSGDLKISGIMNVPKGDGPFPLLILNHGYIDPAIYTNGRGLKREQDYLARRGYVVIHPDYRNHADSGKDETVEINFRLGYTEDVINVIGAVKNANLDYIDTEHIGMLGHSMGGGVTLNTLVIRPDLVDAAVLFAPVSADYRRNFDKWTRQRYDIAENILDKYGTPTSSPEFWNGISAKNYFNRLKTPIEIHHGTIDESVPLFWSDELDQWLEDAGKQHEYYIYDGEYHEFINKWPLVMSRVVDFFDQELKK